MALTATGTGSLYPGSNAKAVYKYVSTSGDVLYTVPSGRILYVSAGDNLKVNNTQMPVKFEGGLTSDNSRHPFWATQGDVIAASSSNAKLVGIEFDA